MAAKRDTSRKDRDDLEGRPVPKVPKSMAERDKTKRLIIVLERSSLETVKVSAIVRQQGKQYIPGDVVASEVCHEHVIACCLIHAGWKAV